MKNKPLWILVGLLLLKLIISIPFITTNPIDLDEPFSIFHAQNSLSGLFEIFQNENNPPLHFVLLHFWEQLFGVGPIAVRSLSLLFSILTIVVLWRTGIKFFNLRTAIIVCSLFIFSDFHQYHGLEARTYSLLVLEFSLLIYLLFSIILSEKLAPLKYAVLLGLINVLLFYTHYISPVIFLAEGIVILIYFKRFQIKNSLISALIFILGVLPWLSVLFKRVDSIKSGGTWLAKAQYSELYGLINKFFNDKWGLLGLIIMIAILFLIQRTKLVLILKNEKTELIILFGLFLIPYLSAFLLSKFGIAEIFYDRYLFFLTIPLFFIVGIILGSNENIYTYTAIGFACIYLFRFDYVPDNDRDGNKLAEFVQKSNAESIVIAPDYYDLTFLYHYDRKLFQDVSIRKQLDQKGIHRIKRLDDLNNLQLNGSVAVIDAEFAFVNAGQSVKNWFLDHDFHLKSSNNFKGNYKVYLFTK